MVDPTDDSLFWQRFLSCAGHPLELDGIWGPKSKAAWEQFHAESIKRLSNAGLDERTFENCLTLMPAAQEKGSDFYNVANNEPSVTASGYVVKFISTTRTYEEQDALYAQGRTKPGPVVTNAKGGQSNHNFGVAWDIGLFLGGEYIDESPVYETLGKIGEKMGLVWGGSWQFEDQPHYQIVQDSELSHIRASFEAGKPFV